MSKIHKDWNKMSKVSLWVIKWAKYAKIEIKWAMFQNEWNEMSKIVGRVNEK
jgi:hypothetical protein